MKQKGLSCFHLSLLSIFVLLLVPILVFSQEPPNIEFKYEYAAKIVCGVQKKSNSRQIGRGLYTTSVNIYNPNDTTATFFKKLVLTYPPGGQKQGKILPITTDFLRADGALQSDCFDLERRLFPNGLPTSFIEGFLVIKSTHSLDVTSVHTASKLGGFFSSQKVTSIDVERIEERKIPPPDVTIKDIQINQAIQDAGHSIQLVAQRSTAVRVTLDTKGKTVSNITGTLHAFVDGVAITPPEGLNPINAPFTAPSSLDMNAENSTLNFELPAPSGIAPSDDVDFIVDIAPLDGEPNITNNRGERTDLEFVETRTPRIFFVRVNWGRHRPSCFESCSSGHR